MKLNKKMVFGALAVCVVLVVAVAVPGFLEQRERQAQQAQLQKLHDDALKMNEQQRPAQLQMQSGESWGNRSR